jgi:hypothetical protein
MFPRYERDNNSCHVVILKGKKYRITKLLWTVPIDHSTEILLHAGFPTFLFILILPLKHKVLYTFL